MPLDQLANIAEISAAALVIVSLIYVGLQVRQNTVTIKSQAVGSANQQAKTELLWFGNKEFAPLFQKSINAPETLTKDDIHQLNVWNLMVLNGRSNDYQLYKMGTLTEERWKVNEPAVKYVLSGEWHRNWLKVGGRHFLEDEFIDWVESVLDGSDFETSAYYESLNLKG